MKKASVKKAQRIIKERIVEVKACNEAKKQDPDLKRFKDLVFRDSGWEGW